VEQFASSRPNSRQHRHLQAETENFFILYFLWSATTNCFYVTVLYKLTV